MIAVDEIIINADPQAVYRAAADVRQWPRILPHYRSVRYLAKGEDSAHLEMAAWRGWLPVRWTAVQRCDLTGRQIHYRHTGGLMKGMTVVWEFTPMSEGTRVVITHDLTLETPIIRSWPGQLAVAYGFVHYIASQTLRIETVPGAGDASRAAVSVLGTVVLVDEWEGERPREPRSCARYRIFAF